MKSVAREVGRLLLTGAPGWLADALVQSLRAEPLPGLSAIRLMVEAGRSPAGGEVVDSVPIECVTADLLDEASLLRATAGVDTVLHAAGILHVRRTRDWYDINTGGTVRLLDAALANRVGRFVFISSNAAAGKAAGRDHVLTESETPAPLSHYGRSKELAERAMRARQGRLETVILRPCMFYGPPVPARHIDVYRRVLAGRMPLVGHGDYARGLTYIDNLVQGCRLAMIHPAASGQTYFISDEPVYTTRRVTEAMAAALGVEPTFVRLPAAMAPVAYTADMLLARGGAYWQLLHLVGEADWHVGVSCAKARAELGYAPTVKIDEGMTKAVAWCRSTGQLP